MNIDQITTKCWILALIIRDDGERLLLGDGWFDFKDNLQHFQPNSIANDIVELQGTDGQLLAGQVRRSASQSFDGYIGDALTSKTEIENRRRQFIQFFRTRRHYKVIYIFPDGTAIQRRMGYLTDAPSVPEMWQKFPEYHVALNFEDVNYYEYAEDAQGDEIYAHESLVKLISVQSGGLVWDEYGAVSHGYTWLNPQTVTGDYITVTDGATGSPLTLSQLTGNATQTTYSGKNLLNINATPTLGHTTVSVSGQSITVTSDAQAITARAEIPFTYEADRQMTISFDATCLTYEPTANNTSIVYLRSGSNNAGHKSIGHTVGATTHYTTTFTPTVAGMNLWLYIKSSNVAGVVSYRFDNIQIEYGASETDYEQYVGGTPAPNPDYPQPISTVTGEQTVKITGSDESQEFEVNLGKNLFDIEQGVTQFTNYSGSVVNNWGSYTDGVLTMTVTNGQNGFVGFSGFKPTLVEGQTYTLSADVYLSGAASTTSIRVGLSPHSSSSPDYLSSKDAWISFSKTYTATASDVADPRLCIEAWSSGAQLQVKNLQLERGSTKSDFAPYFTPIELAKIGTYQDRIYKTGGKWYIEKQIGKVDLGTLTWAGTPLHSTTSITDIKYTSTNTELGAILAEKYTPHIGSGMSLATGCIAVDTNAVRVNDTNAPSGLAYYALATPTDTEITDETLLAQLNFIASLYGGVNNISIVGTGAQGEMTLNYYADVDTTGAGYEWEAGEGGGPTTVQVIGVDNAQPIWTVTGPATNPTLTNITTAQTITWNGTVPNGQKLIIDMANQTATLAGANVYEFITGSWLTLRPGANKLTYSAQGADQASQIQWNGVVG